MLRVLPDSVADGVNKSLGFFQDLTKKSFESFLADKDVSLVLYLTLVLLQVKQSSIFQEDSRKRNSV